jgi:hypothetical protein
MENTKTKTMEITQYENEFKQFKTEIRDTEFNLEDQLYILFGDKIPKIDKIKDLMDKCLIPYNENELIKILTK